MSKRLRIKPDNLLAKLRSMERKGILVSCVRSQNTFYRVACFHVLKAFDRILEYPANKLKQTGSLKKELSGTPRKGNKPSKAAPVASIRK